jgi:hypothetical protein
MQLGNSRRNGRRKCPHFRFPSAIYGASRPPRRQAAGKAQENDAAPSPGSAGDQLLPRRASPRAPQARHRATAHPAHTGDKRTAGADGDDHHPLQLSFGRRSLVPFHSPVPRTLSGRPQTRKARRSAWSVVDLREHPPHVGRRPVGTPEESRSLTKYPVGMKGSEKMAPLFTVKSPEFPKRHEMPPRRGLKAHNECL